MREVKGYWQNYIDGAWVDGGAGRIDVINPGTGEKIAEQALADARDVDLAVQAAKRVHS
ncbi:MAG: aldehyde dehydrogenase family protein, partial [Marinovum sp.]|nr:aldehyde dehydrogenase family protein [Marinovum sp.]